MKTRLILTILTITLAIPLVSYLTDISQMETIAVAAPAPVIDKPSLDSQATTLAEVQARQIEPLGDPVTAFQNDLFHYQVGYPVAWQAVPVAPNVVTFKSPAGTAQVMVTALGFQPLTDMPTFIQQTIADELLIAHQTLMIDNLPAHRVITYSDDVAGQLVHFFVETDQTTFLITGHGDRLTTELIAQSLVVHHGE